MKTLLNLGANSTRWGRTRKSVGANTVYGGLEGANGAIRPPIDLSSFYTAFFKSKLPKKWEIFKRFLIWHNVQLPQCNYTRDEAYQISFARSSGSFRVQTNTSDFFFLSDLNSPIPNWILHVKLNF